MKSEQKILLFVLACIASFAMGLSISLFVGMPSILNDEEFTAITEHYEMVRDQMQTAYLEYEMNRILPASDSSEMIKAFTNMRSLNDDGTEYSNELSKIESKNDFKKTEILRLAKDEQAADRSLVDHLHQLISKDNQADHPSVRNSFPIPEELMLDHSLKVQ